MIGLIFQFAGEVVDIRVDGTCVYFKNANSAGHTTIDGLKLDKAGVVKEFPDLKDNPEWKQEAIKRFKEKIKALRTEEERVEYVITDLKKFGYKPMYKQIKGHRVQKIT